MFLNLDSECLLINILSIINVVSKYIALIILFRLSTNNFHTFQVYRGLLYDIFSAVQSEMNFSYTLIPTATTGSLNNQNNWTGLIGMIARNEVDFSVNDLTVLLSRSKVRK